jgi:hypothetical protein
MSTHDPGREEDQRELALTTGVDDLFVGQPETEQREQEHDARDHFDSARARLPVPLLDELDAESPEQAGEKDERDEAGKVYVRACARSKGQR